MDDRQRLLRLISFVAWAGEPGSNSCGLRFASEQDELRWHGPTIGWMAAVERRESPALPEGNDLRVALWRLTSWYTGAVLSGNDPTNRHDLDTQQLPAVALSALDGIPEDALAMLGRMIHRTMGIGFEVDELRLAQQWADDVRATAWRLLVAEREDRFGRLE